MGGTSNVGTVFEIAAGTTTVTTLANFNGSNGAGPQGNLAIDSAGNLYGTTAQGGNLSANNGHGYGSVFKLTAGATTVTTLLSFNGINGYSPTGGITLDSAGNLYATAAGAGSNNQGEVYKLTAGTNAFTSIYTFKFNDGNGTGPNSGLIADGSGNLYGTTGGGGDSSLGTVYSLALNNSTSSPEPEALLLVVFGSITFVRIGIKRLTTS